MSSAGLHRHIACTLSVSTRHLLWTIAQQIHVEHQTVQEDDVLPSVHAALQLSELDEFSWRLEVTGDNIAAAQALGEA